MFRHNKSCTMYLLPEIRILRDFEPVKLPRRHVLYQRFAGRAVSDFNSMPSADGLPDNILCAPMDEYRYGQRIEDYENYRNSLQKTSSSDKPKSDDSE